LVGAVLIGLIGLFAVMLPGADVAGRDTVVAPTDPPPVVDSLPEIVIGPHGG